MPMTLSAAPNHAQIRSLDSRIRPVQLDGGEDQPVSTTFASYLRKLRPFSTRQHFGRNEVIFQEVDPTERVYRGISGMVRTCRHTANGTRHVADFVLPGELIANAECAEHPFTAEAITPVTLIGYARSSFDRLASSVPAVRVRLVSLLSTNSADCTEATLRTRFSNRKTENRVVCSAPGRSRGCDAWRTVRYRRSSRHDDRNVVSCDRRAAR